jgi:hypothetical protein
MSHKRPPTITYTPTGAVLLVPKQTLTLMQHGLAVYCKRRVEGCCFWYGPKTDSTELPITLVVFPKQINRRGNFTVTSEAIAEMSAATRPLGTINRAQIHTHPSRWVGHSPYDDDHAISRNALSIVLPRYGTTIDAWPKGVGIHEFQNNMWYNLDAQQASQRIRLVEGEVNLIDLR